MSFRSLAFLVIFVLVFFSCHRGSDVSGGGVEDSLQIVEMIKVRESGMKEKDISRVMSQFAEGATWINSQGYYFEGRDAIKKFHALLGGNDSLDYYYEAGQPKIRMIDSDHAMAYYSWKMYWYRKANPADTTYKEIGLMTLTARKEGSSWRWIAVTNQHTPWFYETIDQVTLE